MGEREAPSIYSIAAHRGFADALVAGLIPRYLEPETGLAKLTLLLPSMRTARTISEAFIRQAGELGHAGLLMPRLVTIGDLDLDEAMGNLLDPLSAQAIPPAVDQTRRWFELAEILAGQLGDKAPSMAGLLRLSREMARTMDRVLAEDIPPEALVGDPILDLLGNLSEHWRDSLRLFLGVQDEWLRRLRQRGEVDVATRRNLLFESAAKSWRSSPPDTPLIAAGVTSAAPSLARLLRVIADCPQGAVILPDIDLAMANDAWSELGRAGQTDHPDGEVFGRSDALTHPQYHLKLLLNRMGVAREEVKQWHRRGAAAAEPERSHAISSLFLPPKASRSWVELAAEKRRLSGVRLLTSNTVEEEAQSIALLVREALDQAGKRVAVITPDRSLAARVVHHLSRWNIEADDSAGRPLSLTSAGRLFLLLAELMSHGLHPVTLVATLGHPLVRRGEERAAWLENVRAFERGLRGPPPTPGMEPLQSLADKVQARQWWDEVEPILQPLMLTDTDIALADGLDLLAVAAEQFAANEVWSREDGRALSAKIEDLRLQARVIGTRLPVAEIQAVLREAFDETAIRAPYGGHPRVSIYGLLESRGARADLVICGGLNEGGWPQSPSPDSLLAPGVLRSLGVPGAEFRIGLAAHDLAGAMGAPEVVLSRAIRDADGPTIPSRFLLRVEALLGELGDRHRENRMPDLLNGLDRLPSPAPPYPWPKPSPTAEQRDVKISATALDRLLGDPYQFYAREILRLKKLQPLAADPFSDPALRGTLVHEILDLWHRAGGLRSGSIAAFADKHLHEKRVHPLFWGLWRPRIIAALERFEGWIAEQASEGRTIAATEIRGEMQFDGVTVHGIADRIDRLSDGTLAIVDYKIGKAPTRKETSAGYRLQLGVLGLIAREGGFEDGPIQLSGPVSKYEYWSLRKEKGEFGEIYSPTKQGNSQAGLLPEEFLPFHSERLSHAISTYLKGDAPFTAKENPAYPGYTDYDQLMRLEEWLGLDKEDGDQ